MTNPQHTIAQECEYQGIGLHTGNLCRITFKPAAENSGVTLVRMDLPGQPRIAAHYSHVVSVIRGTTVGNETMRVHTIEHVLSAIYALGLDNLILELNANEPPVADGSSQVFFDTLQEAGLVSQNAEQKVLRPTERIEYRNAESEITLEPSEHLILTTVLQYKHPLMQKQQITATIDPDRYRAEISPARTFCFDYEVEALKKQGLAKGGSLDNAVVVGLDRIHNKEKSLRFPDEFARHKALDLLGDLFLLGVRLKAHITAVKPGHGHNINFVKLLAERLLNATPVAIASNPRGPGFY
jgi:UDP-3-O-acyl N-acetylglucosamine deacetylase